MPGVLGAASIPFIGCIALLVAMILQILAFAAPYWVDDSERGNDFGLWREAYCEEQTTGIVNLGREGCRRFDHWWDEFPAWFDAVRAAECLTIIFWAIPLVILPVYIYVALGLYYRCMLLVMTILTLLGVAWSVVGFIIFGIKIADKSEWDVGWCFIIAVIACGVGIVAFIIFLVATLNRPKFEPERHLVSGFYVDPDRNRMYVVEDPGMIKEPSIIGTGHVNPTIVVTED